MIDHKQFEGHTPGPWVMKKAIHQDTLHFNLAYEDYENERWLGLASVIMGVSRDEAYPSAALMAAAPDLLAENKRLREILSASIPYLEELQAENYPDESVGIRYDQTLEDTLNAARAALNEQK